MPRVIDEEVGKVIRRRVEKTFGDKVKDFLKEVVMGAVGLIAIAVLIKIFA